MNENRCQVVGDLLPLYADALVSEETAAYIESHLKWCAPCRDRLAAVESAPPLPLEAPPVSEADQIAAGLMKRLRSRARWTLLTSLGNLLVTGGLFVVAWRIFAWAYQLVVPPTVASDLLGVVVALAVSLPAALIGARKLGDLPTRSRRWSLAALAVVVAALLLDPGRLLDPRQVPWLRDCPGDQPLRTSGVSRGWYRPPGAPIGQISQAYRLEYTCDDPTAPHGYTRHLAWIGARTGLPLESGILEDVQVAVDGQVPSRLIRQEDSEQVVAVLQAWKNPAGQSETYYQVRLSGGAEATLLFDNQRGDWFVYQRRTSARSTR